MRSEARDTEIRTGWDRVIGQEKVKAFLRSPLRKNRLAHAYLFSGREGSGMDAMAFALAEVVLCEKGDAAACSACGSCTMFRTFQHPDLFLHFPLPVGRSESSDDDPLAKLSPTDIEILRREVAEKAVNPYHPISIPRANQIKVNSIRQMRRQASLGSFGAGKRVFIILNAEKMTTEASNALLKTLEEPIPGTLIILTTGEPESLLPTVISRCQQVRFDPLDEHEIAVALTGRRGVDAPRARLVGRLAAGSYSRAIRLLEADLSGIRDEAVDLLRTFLHKGRGEILDAVMRMADRQKPDTEELLLLLQSWLRDAMLLGAGGSVEVNIDDTATLEKFVQRYPSFDYGAAMETIDRAVSDLYKNVYIHLILHTLGADLRKAASAEEKNPRATP